VLSAGAVYSPIILERSGVGDASILSDLNIPVILENDDVGRNLMDHLQTPVTVRQKRNLNNPYRNFFTRLWERIRYVISHDGLYAESRIGLGLFFKLLNSTPFVDFQTSFLELPPFPELFSFNGSPLSAVGLCLNSKTRGEVHYSGSPGDPVGGGLVVGRPGTLKPNYLESDDDVLCLAKGQKRLREILIATGIILGEDIPGEGFRRYGDEAFEFTVDELRSLLPKYSTFSGVHFTSSLSLGKVVDNDTVEVYGFETLSNGTKIKQSIKGLHVTDASIIPRNIRVNTMATVYAVSEHASSLILGIPL